MKKQFSISLANLPRLPLSPQVSLGVIRGKQHKELTELIARFALCRYFHFIVGGEWLPDQDSLRRSVRRYTTAVNETLDHPILGRPSTCLQLRDQLTMADAQQHPIFILDFLNHFYDPDVDLSLRQRVLKQCCNCLQDLSQSKICIHTSTLGADRRLRALLSSSCLCCRRNSRGGRKLAD